MLRYFSSEHSDVSMMAEDFVFTLMATVRRKVGLRVSFEKKNGKFSLDT
jgi:hypothetical protein